MKGTKVVSRVRVPIEGNDPSHLTQAVQRAVSQAALKTKRLAVSIPTEDVLFRFFTIPVVPTAEWDSVVQFEARRYIPFKIDSLSWDYRVMPSKGASRLEVIFAAIQRDTFRRIQEVLLAAGIQPVLIEPGTLSLARLVESDKGKPANEFICIVDVEHDNAHLAIIKNHIPYLTRDFGLPTHEELGTEAQGNPQATSAPVDTPRPSEPPSVPGTEPAAAADQRAQRLLTELSVSMDFFTREYPSTTVANVFLFGDETVLGPWCRVIADQLRCSVALGSTFLIQHVPEGIPLSFASSIGLLEGVKNPRGVWLDFLKRSPVKAPSATRLKVTPAVAKSQLTAALKTPQAVITAIVCAGLLALITVVSNQQVSTARERFKQLVKSRPMVSAQLSTMNQKELQSLKDRITAQQRFLAHTLDQRVSIAAKLDALVRVLPDGVWITALAFEDAPDEVGRSQFHLTISGACFLGESGQELSAIQQFEEQIKRNPKFFSGFEVARVGRISSQGGAQQQYTYQTFQLDCNS